MERMPASKPEQKPIPNTKVIDWCLSKVRADETLGKYAVVLEQGKRDMAAGKVLECEFVQMMREMKYMLDAESPEEEEYMLGVERFLSQLLIMRSARVDAKLAKLGGNTHNHANDRHDLGPPVLPPLTSNESIEA